jgi:hypothetical protein
MLRNLIREIKKSVGSTDSIKKRDVLIGVDSLKRVLEETMKVNSLSIQDTLKTTKAPKVIKLLATHGVNVSTEADIVAMLKVDYETIYEMISETYVLIDEVMPEISIQDTITIKQSAVLDILDHIDTLANYYSELLMLIVYNLNEETQIIYKKKTEDIVDGLEKYEKMMRIYRGNVKKVMNDIRKLSDVRVIENEAVLNEVTSNFDKIFKLPINGFNGNPIQAIGKWWVDFELYRADKAEDTKYLVEYKLLQLREKKERGNVTVETDEAIAYYEKRVQKLDKKIASLRGV